MAGADRPVGEGTERRRPEEGTGVGEAAGRPGVDGARLLERGATVWFTGLPAAGKTTTARAVAREVLRRGIAARHLDGDDLRTGLNSDLGFGHGARAENVRRVGEVARLFAASGMIAVVSLISPFAASRDQVRARHGDAGLELVEVWVSTPLGVCEERDPKGLYARARRGDLHGLTGVDDPYEPPPAADVVVPAHELDPHAACAVVVEELVRRRIIPPSC